MERDILQQRAIVKVTVLLDYCAQNEYSSFICLRYLNQLISTCIARASWTCARELAWVPWIKQSGFLPVAKVEILPT